MHLVAQAIAVAHNHTHAYARIHVLFITIINPDIIALICKLALSHNVQRPSSSSARGFFTRSRCVAVDSMARPHAQQAITTSERVLTSAHGMPAGVNVCNKCKILRFLYTSWAIVQRAFYCLFVKLQLISLFFALFVLPIDALSSAFHSFTCSQLMGTASL